MIPAVVTVVLLSQALPTLTLAEALDEAEQKSLEVTIAKERLAQAQLASRKVWSNYLPQLSVQGSYQRNSTDAVIKLPTGYFVRNVGQPQGPAFDPSNPPSPENPPGAPTTDILFPSGFTQATIQKRDQLGAQARLTQAIFAPALWPAIRAAYLSGEVAELSTENARRELLFGTAQLYYGAVALQQAIEVQKNQLQLNQQRERDAKVRVELGTAPKVALLRAEIDRARSEQDLERARNAYLSQKEALAALLQRDPRFEVTLPEAPPVPNDLLGSASSNVAQRPDVAAAESGVLAAKAQRRSTQLRYLPSVGFTAQAQWANVTGFTGQSTTWWLGLGVSWTLLDGGLREAELSEAGHRLLEAEATAERAKVNAITELRRAALDLDSAIANEQKAREQVALAQENVTLVNAGYEAGTATYLEVADAATSLLGAKTGAVAEQLNLSLARLRLLKAAGRFEAVPRTHGQHGT